MTKWTKKYIKEYYKQRYQANKKKRVAQVKAHRDSIALWFQKYKSTLKCSKCPENHPKCLDFHHLDETTKIDGVSNMAGQVHGKESILKEISKCIVICSNCHRKLHDYI